VTISDDQLNNEVDIQQDLTNRTTTNIIVDSANLANGDFLQYDSTSRQFEPRTAAEAGLYASGGTDVAVTDGGTGASTASEARTNLGLGTIATQNSNNVTITGGTVSGVTLSSSAATITGGTVSGVTLSSSAATITGGSVTGITDLAVADGGTGVSTLTGIVKGNGTSAFSAASAGTDYYAPGSTDVAVADGGTGLSSATAYAVLCGGTTSTGAFQSIASVGSSGYVLTSNGAGALPTMQSPGAVTNKYVFISTQSASTSAQIDFTGLDNSYQVYFVQLDNIVPSTDNVTLNMRVGTGGTPTYDTGSNYAWSGAAVHTAGTEVNGGSSSATEMQIVPTGSNTTNLGSSTGENLSGIVYFSNPSNSSLYKVASWKVGGFSAGALPMSCEGSGTYKSTTAVTAIRFLMSSGNIASGTFTLYGVKNS
jgi:hypothetical protein